MIPSNQVIINLNALKHNFLEIRKIIHPFTKIIGIVKSDAYGHGIVPISQSLSSLGIDMLGVFEIDEALKLRDADIDKPILIMVNIREEDIPAIFEYNLTPTIFQFDIAERLSQYAKKMGKVIPLHLKIDTGMTRLGMDIADYSNFLKKIIKLEGIFIQGVSSHLSISEMPNHPHTKYQMDQFDKVVAKTQKAGIHDCFYHIANSGAILEKIGLSYDMVRPGIILYGCAPNQRHESLDSFQPVMTFKSKLVNIRNVSAKVPISYGGTFVTKKKCMIATIPVGYDDGYFRLLSNKGEVLVHGYRAPIVGNICMNMTMIDVTYIKDVCVGDEVVLLGTQGQDRITAEEIASKIGTINYEILCSIGKNNYRIYK